MQSVHPDPDGQPQEETEAPAVQPDGEEAKRLANITAAAAYFEAQRELGRQAYRNGEPVSMMFGEFEAEGWHEAEKVCAEQYRRESHRAFTAQMAEYRPGNSDWERAHSDQPCVETNWGIAPRGWR